MSSEEATTDLFDSLREYRGPNRFYRLGTKKSLAIDSLGLFSNDINDSAIPSYVNTSEMSVRALISTPAVDRVGDIIIPTGMKFDNFRLNPAVLWQHGLDDGLTKPIGKAEDPNGNLEIQVSDQGVISKSWFARSCPIAAQIFELIAEKIVRGVSVRETPIKSHLDRRDNQQVMIVDECDLEEWSFCAIAVQPEAVAKCVSRNRLDGRTINPSIMKSLNAICPPSSKSGIGFVEKKMADFKTAQDALVDDMDKDPATNPADETGDTLDGTGDTAIETEASGDPEEDNKLGRQGIGLAHDDIKCLRGKLRGVIKCMEHPEVKDVLQGVHDRLGDEKVTLEGAREAHYPESSALKDEDMSDDGGSAGHGDDQDSAMKSMLNAFKPAQYKAHAVTSLIKSVLKSEKNLSADGRKKLLTAMEAQTILIAQSASHKPAEKSRQAEKKTEIPDDKAKRLLEDLESRLAS